MAANREWRRRNKEKQRAHSAVAYAIRSGKLERQPCEECGVQPTEAHHEDYSKPFDVMWLCKTCHEKRHREIEMEKQPNIPFNKLHWMHGG